MKRATIEKVIAKKIKTWIATIDNLEVYEAIRKDTIVTGGSIASMLMGEKANDFDVYFKSNETALMVANYYVKKFQEKTPTGSIEVKMIEAKNIRDIVEERVSIYIKSRGIVGQNPDNEEPTDEIEVGARAQNEEGLYFPVFISENAITLTDRIQIITRFAGEPEEIHKNFDFAHAFSWYDHETEKCHLDPLALECILSKTLIYKGSLYPISSIFRVRKFMSRGWKISAGQLLKIMWQISEINLKDRVILRDQLTGVDSSYFNTFITVMEEYDADKLNSLYIGEVINRIFGE